MISAECPTCGSVTMEPDPPPRTQDEKVSFRIAWDARVAARGGA